MPKRSGFTLIELLIVITIIAVLSAVGLVSYTNVMKSSRDAKRQSDLKFIQSALEEYHSDQIHYPFTVTSGSPIINPAGTKTYLTTVPSDPIPDQSYSYVSSGTGCASDTPQNCTSYCLYTQFEGTNNLVRDAVCTPTAPFNWGLTRP